MQAVTPPSISRLRRCSRRYRRRRRSSQPQLFMLYISVAAVIALFVAFHAEAVHPHHHQHYHHQGGSSQRYARERESRNAAAERQRGAGQPEGPWSSAAAGAASESSIPASQPSGRVEELTASTAIDHRTPRHGAAAAHPPLPAFVGAPSGWRRAPSSTGWRAQSPPAAAAEAAETRRRFSSSMTRQHSATQQQQQQQQQQQHQPLQIPTASQTDLAGSGGPRHDPFYRANPTAAAASRSYGGGGGDYGGYPRNGYNSPWSGCAAAAGTAAPTRESGNIGSRNSAALTGTWHGGPAGGRGVGMAKSGEEGMDGQEIVSRRPPMLVTIGPQCAGKTSLLRELTARSEAGREGEEEAGGAGAGGAPLVTDVAIDDQPSVYHKIPIALLLGGCARGSREDVRVARRPLSERLQDAGCVEARFVALRLSGRISAEEMMNRLRGYGAQASPHAMSALCGAVENAVSENVRISTPTVDVFIREGLFPTAITSSQEKLAAAARDCEGMVAWGNTNTQARDYRAALEQAELTGRPVRFLRWGYELPLLSLEELSRRNVGRFAATGRFIETAAVETALARVDKLYASTSGGNPASLALAAGFEMDAYGRVRSTRPPHHHHRQHPPSTRRRDGPQSRDTGGRGGGDRQTRRRRSYEGPQGGGNGASGVEGSEAFLSGGGRTRAVDNGMGWGGTTAGFYGSGGGSGSGSQRQADQFDWRQATPSDERLPLPPPPIAQPLPPGPGHFTFDGDGGRRYGNEAAATAPLGLAQGWAPRGGSGGDDARGLVGAGGGDSSGPPPTVMFGNEWGRKRGWRRTGYTDDDIDPSMSSCFFRTPANSTGTLKRNDLGEGMGADLEEMELVRRIRSFRQRR